jgi:hypothetical protein
MRFAGIYCPERIFFIIPGKKSLTKLHHAVGKGKAEEE